MTTHYSSSSPLRVSFLGGGSDFKNMIEIKDRIIFGMAINYFININAYKMPGLYPERTRIQYSKVEEVDKIEDIEHNAIREILKFKKIKGINISIASDMPSGSGLGSSSSFTCGMLNILARTKGQSYTSMELANDAIHIEQEILKENVGIQDQILCATGGLKLIKLHKNGYSDISYLLNYKDLLASINKSSFLIFTGKLRQSSIVQKDIESIPEKNKIVESISEISDFFYQESSKTKDQFGLLKNCLKETWENKKVISRMNDNNEFLNLIDKITNLGCSHFKLLGAGGGGFIYCLVDSNIREKFVNSFSINQIFQINASSNGSISYKIEV